MVDIVAPGVGSFFCCFFVSVCVLRVRVCVPACCSLQKYIYYPSAKLCL